MRETSTAQKQAETPKKLTAKEQAWADAFLVTLNKAESARRAKYKGDSVQLANVGWQNYRKSHIQAYLKDKLDEMAMSANEVLARLSEQASADMSDFLEFKEGVKLPFLDLKTASEKGLLRLVKKFKYNSEGHPEIELYDAQAALVHLGKAHGLFKDTVTNLNYDLTNATDEQLQRIAAGEEPATVLQQNPATGASGT